MGSIKPEDVKKLQKQQKSISDILMANPENSELLSNAQASIVKLLERGDAIVQESREDIEYRKKCLYAHALVVQNMKQLLTVPGPYKDLLDELKKLEGEMQQDVEMNGVKIKRALVSGAIAAKVARIHKVLKSAKEASNAFIAESVGLNSLQDAFDAADGKPVSVTPTVPEKDVEPKSTSKKE